MRLCIVCDYPSYDRCDAGSRFSPIETAELSLWGSRHFAFSRACRNDELASLFGSHGIFFTNPGLAPAGSSKMLAPPSTSQREENPSLAPRYSPKTLRPASVNVTKDVLEVPVSTAFRPAPVFEVFDFEKIGYRGNVLNADHTLRGARLVDPDYVAKLGNNVREGRWVNNFGSFPVAEKTLPSDRFSVPFSAVGDKLLRPLHVFDGWYRRAKSEKGDDSGIGWGGSANKARVQS